MAICKDPTLHVYKRVACIDAFLFRYTGFVHFLDSFKSPHFTYLSSTGFKALDEELEAQRNINDEMVADSEDEDAGSDAEAG